MGNCIEKQKPTASAASNSTAASHSHYNLTARSQPPPVIAKLHGPPESPLTSYLRFALSYKPVTLRFTPSSVEEEEAAAAHALYTLETGDDAVSGSAESIMEYAEAKFPHPPLLARGRDRGLGCEEEVTPLLVRMARLQHTSMRWHVERVVRWGVDLAARGGKSAVVDPGVGTPRMEVRKFAKSYGMLLEVMLEHAQMEERAIFPILERADPGLCTSANKEHARDLPVMNGIKEAIKSVVAIDAGTPDFREALYNLSSRLETLQENCKEHFEEEEKYIFPLMEAAVETNEQERRVLNQCIDLMPGTHSHLFGFFIEGLLPREAMQYLDLLINYNDQERVGRMLRTLVE
ncbi:hypothetical protein Dimus_011608 [Dionaea muscipula]